MLHKYLIVNDLGRRVAPRRKSLILNELRIWWKNVFLVSFGAKKYTALRRCIYIYLKNPYYFAQMQNRVQFIVSCYLFGKTQGFCPALDFFHAFPKSENLNPRREV